MRKWLVAAVVLAALVAGGLAYVAANLDRYLAENRAWLEAQAEAAIGRPVTFSGVTASLLGGVGATVENVRIADDPAFSTESLLSARRVRIGVKVLPALFGRWEVRRVSLDAPHLTIVRDKDGLNLGSLGAKRPGAGTPDAGSGTTAPAAVPELLVALLDVKDGELRLVDRTTSPPAESVIRGIDVDASDLSLTTPLRITASAAILGSSERNVSIEGRVGPLGNPPAPLAAPVDLTLRVGPIDSTALRRDVPLAAAALPAGVTLDGPIALDVRASGTLDTVAVEGTLDATATDVRRGETFRKPPGVPLRVSLAAARTGQGANVKRLQLRLAELEVTGAGTVSDATPPAIDVALDVARTPLAGWDRLLPALAGYQMSGTTESHLEVRGEVAPPALPAITGTVTLADVAARKAGAPIDVAGLTGTMTLRGDTAELPPTSFTLGGAPVEVALGITSLTRPAGRVAVKAAAVPAAALGAAGAGVKTPEVIRGLDLALDVSVGADGPSVSGTVVSTGGSLRDLAYERLRAKLSYAGGVAVVDEIDVQAYGGTYGGRVRADLRDAKVPRFESRSVVRGMAVEQLTAVHFPAAARAVRGRLDANLDLAGAGAAWEAIKPSLGGSGRLDVRDGALVGVNVADTVLGGVTGIAGLDALVPPRVRQKYPEVFGGKDTKFDRLGGSVAIANQVARSDDLVVAARDYAMRGAGTTTLDGAMNFTATLVASEALTRDIVAAVKEARFVTDEQGRVAIPFRLAGTPPDVRASPDPQFIANALQRGLLDKGINALGGGKGKDKKGGTNELLQKGLKGLFGR